MIMLQVVILMEGEWLCYRGGHFNGESMIMLRRSSVEWNENGHVTEVASLNEGKWSCYKVGQFNEGSMVMLLKWPINRGTMVILLRWPI